MKQKNGGWRHGGGLFRRPIRPESGRFGIRFRRNRCESEKGKLKKKKKTMSHTACRIGARQVWVRRP